MPWTLCRHLTSVILDSLVSMVFGWFWLPAGSTLPALGRNNKISFTQVDLLWQSCCSVSWYSLSATSNCLKCQTQRACFYPFLCSAQIYATCFNMIITPSNYGEHLWLWHTHKLLYLIWIFSGLSSSVQPNPNPYPNQLMPNTIFNLTLKLCRDHHVLLYSDWSLVPMRTISPGMVSSFAKNGPQ